MSLQQLQNFKRWHIGHFHGHSVEMAVCDAVLSGWLMGWMSLPVLVLLDEWAWLPLSLLLSVLPATYWSLRARLHRRGILRCDWLSSVQPNR